MTHVESRQHLEAVGRAGQQQHIVGRATVGGRDGVDRAPLVVEAGIPGQVTETARDGVEDERRWRATDIDGEVHEPGCRIPIAVPIRIGQVG